MKLPPMNERRSSVCAQVGVFLASRQVCLGALTVACFAQLVGQAEAAGFAFLSVSPSGVSVANANPAEAEDASVIWFNPAGMTNLDGTQVTTNFGEAMLGVGYVISLGDFDKDSAQTVSSGGAPATGGDGGNFGGGNFTPSFYAAYRLDGVPMETFIGLGINTPFGLSTDYNSGWVGRYDALKSELTAFNANPSLAVKLNEFVSVGVGFNVLYSDVKLSQAIDTGVFFGAPAADDSSVELKGDGLSVGYNVGLMFFPNENFRFGVAYRSSMQQDIDGNADFDLSATGTLLSTITGTLVDTGISSQIDLPDTLSVHAFYQATDNLAMMADATWTNWSRFQSVRIAFDNPLQPDQTLEFKFRDTIRIAAGATYNLNDEVTMRFGAAFDESPQPDDTRGFRLPDSDRWIIGAGTVWSQPGSWLKLGFGYSFFYLEDADVDVVTPTGAPDGSFNEAAGTSHSSAHLFVLDGSIRF